MPPVTYLEAIRRGLWEEMERDPAVFCLGEDIGVYGGAFKVTEGMIDRFGPERIIDTPIAESAIVGAAFGSALLGMRPVVEFQFMDFIGCAFNQITNMLAKAHYRWGAPAPVVLRGPSGAGVHGGPFHSQNPEMHFVHTPGLKVVCPGTPSDAYGLIKSAIRDNNPVIFFEHKLLYRRLKEELPAAHDFTVPLGKARVVREGKHVSIITYAAMLQVAIEAAQVLVKEGTDVEVLDLRTLQPFDREAIVATVKKTNLVIILHEDTKTGGIAGEISAVINEDAFDDLEGPIVRITSLDAPVPFSPPLEHRFLPSVRDVVEKVRWLRRQVAPCPTVSVAAYPNGGWPALQVEENGGPGEVVPMSATRRDLARRAVDSKRTSPHVYTVDEVDLSRVAASVRESANKMQQRRGSSRLVYAPFVAWAACRAMREYPVLNSSVEGDSIRYQGSVRLAIKAGESSVAERIISDAQEKTLAELQSEIHHDAGNGHLACREGSKVPPTTFTIALAPEGAVADFPLIQQPQVAILAIGTAQKRPAASSANSDSDCISIVQKMRITLVHDHRVIDGSTAVKYLAELKRLLESWPP
jgi:pyruvate/2-oxoglutarate/acetoin dehydrogenase E1 component